MSPSAGGSAATRAARIEGETDGVPGAVRIALASVIAVLGTAGCFPDESLARLDGDIAVEWVHKSELGGGGRGVGISEWEILRFTRPQKLEVVLTGSFDFRRVKRIAPQLAASTSGAELAYRAAPGTPWRFMYLNETRPRAVLACGLRLGDGEAPAWAALPSFEQAAPDILKCAGLSPGVFEEARARAGDRGLANVLVASRTAPIRRPNEFIPPPPAPYDEWEGALDTLPSSERDRVIAALAGDVATAGSDPAALARALWRVEPIDAALLAARARELAPAREQEPLPILLSRLITMRREEAGAVACAALPAVLPDWRMASVHTTSLAVVASARTPCPAVALLLQQHPDDPSYDCGEDGRKSLCTAEQLAPLVETHIRRVATDRRFRAPHAAPQPYAALLAAGYAQGSLPATVVAAAERRRGLQDGCAAFHTWRLRSRDEVQVAISSEEWNAARTHAQRAVVRRKKARAYEAQAKRAPEIAHAALRAIEVRHHECAARWAAHLDEEAAAYEAGNEAAIAAATERDSQLYLECSSIDNEGMILCQRYPPVRPR